MSSETWTAAEKKIARRVFEAALDRELDEIMAEFKVRAASANEPEDKWVVQHYLAQARRDIERRYDYRYLQLEIVFGILLRAMRIDEQELTGLDLAKLDSIRRVASL